MKHSKYEKVETPEVVEEPVAADPVVEPVAETLASMIESIPKAPESFAEKCAAEAKKLNLDLKADEDADGNVIIGTKDAPLLKVQCKDGLYSFVALKGSDKFGVVEGQTMFPSCQNEVAHHAACCARDLA